AFSLITTHRANITVEFFNRDSTKREVLYQGDNDGAREMPFKGLMRDGTRVDSTTWEFRVKGASRVQSGSAEERQVFKIEYAFEPLEDTLPSFKATDTLQTEYRATAPWID